MLLEMVAATALAATQAQGETAFSTFDAGIPGWNVVRRPDGCFVFTEAADANFNLFYKVGEAQPSLVVLVSSAAWRLSEADVRGYRIQFVGADGDWTNLNAYTFQDTGDGENFGVISMAFSGDAVVPMLTDIHNAASLNFYNGTQLLASIALRNSPRAVQRLLDCVRTVTNGPVATIPAR